MIKHKIILITVSLILASSCGQNFEQNANYRDFEYRSNEDMGELKEVATGKDKLFFEAMYELNIMMDSADNKWSLANEQWNNWSLYSHDSLNSKQSINRSIAICNKTIQATGNYKKFYNKYPSIAKKKFKKIPSYNRLKKEYLETLYLEYENQSTYLNAMYSTSIQNLKNDIQILSLFKENIAKWYSSDDGLTFYDNDAHEEYAELYEKSIMLDSIIDKLYDKYNNSYNYSYFD